MEKALAMLGEGSTRRAAAAIVTAGLIALNNKLGLGLTEFQIGAITAIVVAYIAGSNWKAAAQAKGEAAAAAVTTMDAAVAEMKK